MPITALPTPPSRADKPNFSARSDAFVAALPLFVTEVNALLDPASAEFAAAIDSLKAFNSRGAWVTATLYAVKDLYLDGATTYVTLIEHTSTSVAADLAAGKVGVHQGATLEVLAAPGGAALIGNTPAGTIAATTVQGAINEIVSDLAASTGSGLMGWIRNAVGAIAATLSRWLGWQRVSLFEFMTDAQITDAQSGAPTLDCTAALAAAQAHAASLPYGVTLQFPRGAIKVTAIPAIVPKVNWAGEGRLASQILYSGTGDGLKYAGAVNAYMPLRTSIRDMAIVCTNAANTGGGVVLESCAYIELHNIYIEKFKYGHILDQVTHFKCDYSEIAQQTRAGVWIVNGADRRVGANTRWTNNIWYGKEVQINETATAGIYGIQDDGGVNHSFSGINFNGADILVRIAGVSGLTLNNSAFESSLQTPIIFTNTARESGAYVGQVDGFSITDITASSATTYEILLEAATNGKIEGNNFASMIASAIGFGAGGGGAAGQDERDCGAEE